MNKICILAKNPNTYFLKRLRGIVGYNFEFFNPWESLPDFDTFSQILIRTTGVYGSDKDLEAIEKIPDKKLLNNYLSLKTFRGKDSQYAFFKESNIPHLPWMLLGDSSAEKREQFLQGLNEKRPVLVKPLRGQGGWGIEVFKTSSSFDQWWKSRCEQNDLSYLIQPYLEKTRECRVFFIQNDLQLALERIPVKGVAANFTQEGKAIQIDVPHELSALVQKLIKETGISYGALDCLFHEGHWIVLEVNAVPGVEQLEKVTGLNILGEFTQRLLTP